MRKPGACTTLSIGLFCALLSLSPGKAGADTVTVMLVSTGGQQSGPYFVYPYNFSVNGSAVTTPLMCISYTKEISFGETWTAIREPVTVDRKFKEAAYIFSTMTSDRPETIIDAQWANWELFDPGDQNLLNNEPAGDRDAIESLLDQAALFVKENPNSRLYASYEIYVPQQVDGRWPAQGEPQFLIGDPPTDLTPEPSSLVLLGSGLLGLASLLYWRQRPS